jgi:hypothetical protein
MEVVADAGRHGPAVQLCGFCAGNTRRAPLTVGVVIAALTTLSSKLAALKNSSEAPPAAGNEAGLGSGHRALIALGSSSGLSFARQSWNCLRCEMP